MASAHYDSVVAVTPHLLPFLNVTEVVRFSATSKSIFNAVRNSDNAFWSNVDFSCDLFPSCCLPPLFAFLSSQLSLQGRLVTGLTVAFSPDFNDRGVTALPSDEPIVDVPKRCLQRHILNNQAPASFYQEIPVHTVRHGQVPYDFPIPPSGLRALNLNSCKQITDDGLLSLSQQSRRLETLQLYWNAQLTDRSLVPVIRSNGKTLKGLNLSGCKGLTDSTLKAIARYCGPSLRDLDLTRLPLMTDVGLVVLCESVLHLNRLILYANQQLTAIPFKTLKRLSELKELDLCGARITDDGIRAICDGCHQLRVLNLTWCTRLTDRSLEYLAHSASVLEGSLGTEPQAAIGLRSLSLHGISVLSKAGFHHLIESPHAKTLEALDIRGCPQLREYIDNHFVELRKVFPKVTNIVLHS